MHQKQILRILDANLNRSREGLRVCEEVMRFTLADTSATRELKKTRHAISRSIGRFPVSLEGLVQCRDTGSDVGKKANRLESKRPDGRALFIANIERAKESLRVLEETSKLLNPKLGILYKKIRFRVYAIEKTAMPKLETLRYRR